MPFRAKKIRWFCVDRAAHNYHYITTSDNNEKAVQQILLKHPTIDGSLLKKQGFEIKMAANGERRSSDVHRCCLLLSNFCSHTRSIADQASCVVTPINRKNSYRHTPRLLCRTADRKPKGGGAVRSPSSNDDGKRERLHSVAAEVRVVCIESTYIESTRRWMVCVRESEPARTKERNRLEVKGSQPLVPS